MHHTLCAERRSEINNSNEISGNKKLTMAIDLRTTEKERKGGGGGSTSVYLVKIDGMMRLLLDAPKSC